MSVTNTYRPRGVAGMLMERGMDEDIEIVVITVHHCGKTRWFRSDRDLWVLDVNKWRNEFISHGYDVPDFNETYRFGIRVVNQETAERFLEQMSKDELSKDELALELVNRFTSAQSWWDVSDLFPIIFVDFDKKRVGAFYPQGTPMERYVPDGWIGEFIDFATEYDETAFPAKEKFWVKGDSDLLKLLNERGSKL